MTDFSACTVTLPATDGLLADLGHDVATLGQAALGIVIETRHKSSHVHYPELNLSLWQENAELVDVFEEAQTNAAYKKLLPDYSRINELPVVFIQKKLFEDFEALELSTAESGSLETLWESEQASLSEFYTGSASIKAYKWGLALQELKIEQFEKAKAYLKERLLFARFLPLGMQKIETLFYLR